MLATTDTMFVNEKMKKWIYSICPFSSSNTRQMHFKRNIVKKPQTKILNTLPDIQW